MANMTKRQVLIFIDIGSHETGGHIYVWPSAWSYTRREAFDDQKEG